MVTDRDLATQALAEKPKQLEVWILADRGLSLDTIALHLDLSRSSVRDRLKNARRNIARARKDTPT